MVRRLAPVVLIATYMAVLVLPVVFSHAHKTRFVNGALPREDWPRLRLAAVLDESFQRDATRSFESDGRLFGYQVYLDNTFLYRVFGETRVGARVRLGRDPRVLFIDEDIEYLNQRERNLPTAEDVDALAARIAHVQALFRARGQALVPVIGPAKTTVYRDAVDPRWVRFATPTLSDVVVYQGLVAAFAVHGVVYVDMRAELTSGAYARADLWAPSGRHWSDYAACLTLAQVVGQQARLLERAPMPYPCVLGHRHANSGHDDFDLWRLLNVWGARPARFDIPFAVHEPVGPAVEPRPRALFIGTSFNYELVRDAAASHRFGAIHLHYYDTRMIAWPEETSVPMVAGSPGWRAQLADSDLVVLDMMEVAVFSGQAYLDTFLSNAADQNLK